MKNLLLIGLMVAASTAAVAATHDEAMACAQAPTQTSVAHKFGPLSARPNLNCGFICDSFGRCYRVCW